MDEIQRAAFLQAQATCAIVEALGMMVENQEARSNVASVHGRKDFEALIDKYGIGHNAALSWLQGR